MGWALKKPVFLCLYVYSSVCVYGVCVHLQTPSTAVSSLSKSLWFDQEAIATWRCRGKVPNAARSVRCRKMLPAAACSASAKKSNLFFLLCGMKCPLGVQGVVPAELGGLELEPVLDILSLCVRWERSRPFIGGTTLAFTAHITDVGGTSLPDDELLDSSRSLLRCLRCLRSSSFLAEPGW